MAVMYPKFGDARPLEASNPGAFAPPRDARAGVHRTWAPGAVFRLVLLAVLAWGVNDAFRPSREVETDQVAIPAAQFQSEAMLNMSAGDAALLRGLPDRVEGACERNKYQPGQQECHIRLRERGGMCLAQVARRYPAHGGDTDHTPMIIGAYLQCVFEQ